MTYVALVDCNAFFCSCERLFRPDTWNKPVAVLSNNDGCLISLTRELKDLGLKVGTPYFKVKDICEQNSVQIFSSNFSLYVNLSDRIMSILSTFTPSIEIYSIDEAFIFLDGMEHLDLKKYAEKIKETVFRYTGIPVSIGIARTKTLAKVANHFAKRNSGYSGVAFLSDRVVETAFLENISVGDLWGVGRKNREKLQSMGISTGRDFRDFKNRAHLQKVFGKLGLITRDELDGISCVKLNEKIKKKSLTSSRTFRDAVSDIREIRESVSEHIAKACERLRKQNSKCEKVHLFFSTGPHNKGFSHGAYEELCLSGPTSDTRKVIKYAVNAIEELYKIGMEYKRSGITIDSISNRSEVQLNMFEEGDSLKSEKLMEIVDAINDTKGPGTVVWGTCSLGEKRSEGGKLRSPRYLSGWNNLPKLV